MLETEVLSASPAKLRLMMIEFALVNIADACQQAKASGRVQRNEATLNVRESLDELLCGIRVRDVAWSKNSRSLSIRIHRDQIHRSGPPYWVELTDYMGVSAYSLLHDWFNEHDLWTNLDSFIFPRINSKRGSRRVILDFPENYSKSRYRTDINHYFGRVFHSPRAGAATDLFQLGFSTAQVGKIGRWKSDAVKIYYRASGRISRAAARGFAKRYAQVTGKQVGK